MHCVLSPMYLFVTLRSPSFPKQYDMLLPFSHNNIFFIYSNIGCIKMEALMFLISNIFTFSFSCCYVLNKFVVCSELCLNYYISDQIRLISNCWYYLLQIVLLCKQSGGYGRLFNNGCDDSGNGEVATCGSRMHYNR